MRLIKVLDWAAAIGAVCSAAGFLRAGVPSLAALEVVCATGLAAGSVLKTVRVTRLFQLLLLLQAVVLGAIWPSAITLVALLAIPGVVLAARDLLKNSTRWQMYVHTSAVLAAWSLAVEGWLLTTLQRV